MHQVETGLSKRLADLHLAPQGRAQAAREVERAAWGEIKSKILNFCGSFWFHDEIVLRYMKHGDEPGEISMLSTAKIH